MAQLPNVIIFNPDQFRADALGHLGNPVSPTPNLDRFAQTEAVSFRNAFCQNPVCTPSRCSFMSGWYPHVRGHRTMHHMMKPDEPVLLKTLKENGYFVWWGGKNDLVPGDKPLDDYCDVKHRITKPLRPNLHRTLEWRGEPGSDTFYSFLAGRLDADETGVYADSDWGHVEGAVEFLANPPKDRPFCVYLPIGYPHPPYGVEEPWYSGIDRTLLPPRVPAPASWAGKPSILKGIHECQNLSDWDEARWDALRAVYLGMCARVDHQFGMILEALVKAEVYDNTAIFVLSDHGDFTGDYGLVEKTQNTFEDCLTRVPLIVKPPLGTTLAPGVRDELVELVDFPATVEAIIGIVPKHTHFGKSLLPLMAGQPGPHRDAVFAEGGRLHGEEHCMELESKSTPQDLYWPRLRLQAQEGPEHGKAVMCRTQRYKFVRRLYERDELYDLAEDPHELDNRVDDPDLAGVRAQMMERLVRFYLETGDAVPQVTDAR